MKALGELFIVIVYTQKLEISVVKIVKRSNASLVKIENDFNVFNGFNALNETSLFSKPDFTI